MTDLNKLRSEFEELPEVKQWIERLIYGDKSEVYIPVDETEENNAIATWINGAWFGWQEKAKAQAVPEGYVLLPRVATETMANAFDIGMLESEHFFGELDAFKDAYTAMVKAAGDQNENS